MIIKCLECKHKCGLPFNLTFHYSICHEDQIIKCECGDKTLSGVCIKTLAQRSCLVNHKRSSFVNSPIKTDCSFIVNDNVNVNINANVYVNDNVKVNDNIKDNINVNDNINDLRSSFANNVNQYPNRNPNVNVSVNPRNNKVLNIRCYKCNSVKPLTDFDESKYTCRNYTSAKLIVYIVLLL